ncbi:site-specific integrase [Bacillus kwashiorkori]|uniref:site-specific integrase n=1 Tax=Bacillus kwashiorkori TaxID=1522318 RepID=UPI0007814653|nr:site-specific integrase [Bacillus kwashiorkori]
MYIPLDKKFTWLPREVIVESERVGGKIESTDIVLIGLKNNLTGHILPHPISNFIVKCYKNNQLGPSTQLRAARIISMFLNYIYTQIEDEDDEDIEKKYSQLEGKGVRALELQHGADFITYGTYLGRNSETIAYWETTLTRFYNFLKEQDLIDQDPKIRKTTNKKGDEILISPFGNSVLDIERPNKKQDDYMTTLKDFGENRYDLVKLFIDIARSEASEIALGIYFQFFGGLRVGEVVNLTESALKPKGYRGTDSRSFFVDIDDRQEKLFPNLINNKYNQVKRPRIQYIIHSNLLNQLYEAHDSKLEDLKLKRKLKIDDSLFVSYKTGVPISGPNYAKKFKRVKEKFLEELRENRYYEDLEFLESLPWSTHIGRAVFTNFLIDQGLGIEEIRDSRGDRSLLSAIDYLERRVTRKKIKEMMEKIAKKFGGGEDQEGELDSNLSLKREQNIELYNKVMSRWREY